MTKTEIREKAKDIIQEALAVAYYKVSDDPSEHGDRTSRYFEMARDRKVKERTVKVALIEQVHGLDCDMRGYAIHVIDDVEMKNCEIFHTEHLDRFELEKLLDKVYDDLQKEARI